MSFLKPPRLAALPRARTLSQENGLLEAESTKRLFTLEKVSRLCRKHRRGTAAVEFALVAPIFFLLILGMIEIGRAVMVQQIITNASREGARLAVLPGTTGQEVVTRVGDILDDSGISGATTQVLGENDTPIDPQSSGYGEVIKVRVSVPFSNVSWLPGAKYVNGDLTATTVMRGERVQ